jgi:hypothetical protein
MYGYNQDDRKPALCGNVAVGQHHGYAEITLIPILDRLVL